MTTKETRPGPIEMRTLADVLEVVTVENINRLLADFAEFLRVGLVFNGETGITMAPVFRWIDDGDPGLRTVNLHFGGEESE